MLSLLRHLGYNSYGENGIASPDLPLDPIKVAGQAKKHAMQTSIKKRMNPHHYRIATSFDTLNNHRDTVLLPPCIPCRTNLSVKVGKKWTSHLKLLLTYGILIAASVCLEYSSYFAVEKAGGTAARAVFNGRNISKQCYKPPNVNLPKIADLLRKTHEVSRNGPFWIVTGDIRHFFHQIEIGADVSRLFGVRGYGVNARWATLPMGHSWAPVLAQTLGWALLLHREEDERPLADETAMQTEHLPSFVNVMESGHQVGFLTLYYDNYIMVTTSEAAARAFDQRLKRNSKLFNIELKEHFLFSPKLLRTGECIYLGIQISQAVKRTRNFTQGTFMWRHATAKFNKMEETMKKRPRSRRELARMVGLLVWRMTVRVDTLIPIADALNVLRRYQGEWDALIALSEEDFQTLWSCYSPDNVWLSFNDLENEIIHAASDASDNGWGYVIYKNIGDEMSFTATNGTWPVAQKKSHIFLKEAWAAIKTTRKILAERTSSRASLIILGVDNTAVVAALERMWSTNEVISSDLSRLSRDLRSSNVTLRPVSIRTHVNVADQPSRGESVDPERLVRTFDCLQEPIRGYRTGPAFASLPSDDVEEEDLWGFGDCTEEEEGE